MTGMNDLFLESMAEQRRRDLTPPARRGPRGRRRRPSVPPALWFIAGWVLGTLLRG